MRRMISAALAAIMPVCLAVPFAPAFAQAGISTNPAPLETRDYLAAVHALSRYEVAASRLALARSKTAATRSFAQLIVDHHARSVQDQARALNIPETAEAESALVGPLSEMLDSLQNVSSADFAAAYKRGQVAALEETWKVHSTYAERGRGAEVRARAQRALSITRKHLDMARELPEV